MTVGEYLRQMREKQKLSLQEVSERTNIRIKFLEAIESGDLEIIPSLSQARGFTRLYASFLGLNPLDVFDQIEKPQTDEIPTQNKGVSAAESVPGRIDVGAYDQEQPLPIKKIKRDTAEAEKDSISKVIFEEIGQELRSQREALGLSREDVERQIRIREFFLYALEQGDIDALPSTVQGRGMLSNYAAFLSLDSEAFQTRYAEGLQQRRIERVQVEEVTRKSGKKVIGKEPLTGWRRLLTPDLIIGGGLFIGLFFLVLWGAYQVIRSSTSPTLPTVESISEVLMATDPVIPGTDPAMGETPIGSSGTQQPQMTPLVNLQATLAAMQQGPIQVVVYAHQRAFMRVTVDGREVFNGRVTPGNAYSYTGSIKISILTGNAGGLQVYYNQQDLGVLGQVGEVQEIEFTAAEMATATPRFTPTITRTPIPTLTQLPTNTPTPTVAVPTPTTTPQVP